MRPAIPWPALAGCLLVIWSNAAMAQRPDSPVWVEPDARAEAASPAVERRANALLERTLSGADARALVAEINKIRGDASLISAERDAVLFGYIERLRDFPPGTAPEPLLDWLADTQPLAVTAHEEGTHYHVALFNVAAAAHGLANEWAWRRGHEAVAGHDALPLSTLADKLGKNTSGGPEYRGMRYAIRKMPVERLDVLALHCAVDLDGCGEARADLELARGNLDWLQHWLMAASARDVIPRLRQARTQLPPGGASKVIRTALEHRDPGVVAWAMSDLTAHLPKGRAARQQWGSRLLDLLDDPDLGGAAALQLARMDGNDWLEAAATKTLTGDGRRRLELLAELEAAEHKTEPESEAGP